VEGKYISDLLELIEIGRYICNWLYSSRGIVKEKNAVLVVFPHPEDGSIWGVRHNIIAGV
jgi:hypothetical protein